MNISLRITKLKKTDLEIIKLIKEQIDQLSMDMSAYRLFPENPTLQLYPERSTCQCGEKLIAYKIRTKKLATLSIGKFKASETIKQCKKCKTKYRCEALRSLVPYRCTYGFDVIVYIGMALFVSDKNDTVVQQELAKKNITISLRHIGYLSKRFIVYLSIAHKECQAQIKQHMNLKGGYILHLDGTCEGGSPHIFSAIDAISDFVLDNQKMATENSENITSMLQRIKLAYGNPLALVRDMSPSISNAIEKVFLNIPDYICHYPFLRDLGKDLFEHEHSSLRRHIKTLKTRTILRKAAKELKSEIDQDNKRILSLQDYLNTENQAALDPTVKAYILVSWVIESTSASDGYGFPFDQPHLDFYCRLQEAYPVLKVLKKLGVLHLPIIALKKTVYDSTLISTTVRMQKKIKIFNQLRSAMRIVCPEEKHGLNDEGDTDMHTIKSKVTAFRYSDEVKQLASENISYRKMINQIDKYWNKLFAAPITVTTPHGKIQIQPQRTNNLLERSFRFLKRGARKKGGQQKLSKVLNAMLADTPLIKNLANTEYMKILLNGKKDLIERFAKIDSKQVRVIEKENDARWRKYPKRMGRLFKIQNLPKKLIDNQTFIDIRG